MTIYKRKLTVPPDNLGEVHDFLEIIWGENPDVPLRDKYSFETAIIELTSNIIQYAADVPGVDCEIIVETSQHRLDATISDSGELADLVLDQHIMPDALAESGRGIPLVRALVDAVSFDVLENRNTWRLSKKLTR